MHWMEWETVCRRLSKLLIPGGKLAILARSWGTGVPEEGELYARYSGTHRNMYRVIRFMIRMAIVVLSKGRTSGTPLNRRGTQLSMSFRKATKGGREEYLFSGEFSWKGLMIMRKNILVLIGSTHG
ncbi:hypothetical protein ES705_42664 [subsurface metagenome]